MQSITSHIYESLNSNEQLIAAVNKTSLKISQKAKDKTIKMINENKFIMIENMDRFAVQWTGLAFVHKAMQYLTPINEYWDEYLPVRGKKMFCFGNASKIGVQRMVDAVLLAVESTTNPAYKTHVDNMKAKQKELGKRRYSEYPDAKAIFDEITK